MAADSDMQGRLEVPVITLHAIDDPTALVEYESDYREVVQRAGSQARLLQTFTREDQHSKLSDAEYAALFDALMKWIGTGTKPVVQDIASACTALAAQFKGGCHFDPEFTPGLLFSRVPPRPTGAARLKPSPTPQ